MEIVLQSDTHMTARKNALRDNAIFLSANAKGTPSGVGGQQAGQVLQCRWCRRRAPFDAEAKLEKGWAFDLAARDHVVGQHNMADIE